MLGFQACKKQIDYINLVLDEIAGLIAVNELIEEDSSNMVYLRKKELQL